MASDLANVARCLDLQAQHIVDAVAGRETARALLEHLAGVSAPDTGVAKVLLVFARMSTTACDWLDGDLTIELAAEGAETRVDVTTDLGGGLRERVFSPLVFRAPLVEFSRAIERVPHMIAPLVQRGATAKKIVLAATSLVRRTSIPPASVEIAPEHLFVRVPPAPPPVAVREERDEGSLPVVTIAKPAAASSVPPKDVDSGWDD